MKYASAAILILLTCSTAIIAQEHKERSAPTPQTVPQTQIPPSSQAQPYPYRYNSPEGRYTISLPGEPRLNSQNVTTPDGAPLTQYMAMVADGKGMLMVAYFDYASDVQFNLDKARDGMVNSIRGSLIDEHSISLGGEPGRQIRVLGRTEQGMEFVDRARFYDVKPRVYVLQCLIPKMLDGPAIAERCNQFFDSFRARKLQ